MTPTQPPGLRADERDPLYDDAYIRGVAVGFAADDSRRITLLRIADRVQARAALTPQPATSEEREGRRRLRLRLMNCAALFKLRPTR